MIKEPITLDALPCTYLKGVGPKVTQYLDRLNIHTVQDLLFHLPLRYEDRTYFKSLKQLKIGDHVQVVGRIIHANIKEGRRKSLLIKIEDETGTLLLRFFHFNPAQLQALSKKGETLHCYGEVRWGMSGYEMIHPEYSFKQQEYALDTQKSLTPIYPTTEGLNQFSWRKLIDQALKFLEDGAELDEYLPSVLLEKFGLPTLIDAVKLVHRPPVEASRALLDQGIHPAQQRLVFEELLAHQLILARIRLRTKSFNGPPIEIQKKLVASFIQTLPYSLTNAQVKVIEEIRRDLASSLPMLRLVQGDVGSGKTVVAAIAALYLIECGFQVAIMAPTELLAEQHYKNFFNWFNLLEIKVICLTSATKGKAREDTLQKIAVGYYSIIIGTHALFQKEVVFSNLGLIIIDEQHRFGVHQRLALLNKGITATFHPHQIVMSATPIPRTLTMTAYADLDCSIIDELPPGRTPVKTLVLPNSRRENLIERIKEKCEQGAQVYWVCTLIQESEILQCQAAEDMAQELQQSLSNLRVNLIHGRMKPAEKEKIMLAFKNKEIDLLVATTVIEVGVDVPNASLMVIENAERLGLAQLHQLRGRVGRGAGESHCILLYQTPLSRLAKERLATIRDTTDGFIIAEKDLALRGPGEILGTKQTGLIQFKIADLARDQHQLPIVQEAATILLNQFPGSVDAIIERWLANKDQFCEV